MRRLHLATMAFLAGMALGGASLASATIATAAPVTHPDVSGGTWGNAANLPGTRALNTGGEAAVEAVSCTSPDSCAAGGYYATKANEGMVHGFVDVKVNGTWRVAQNIPGLGALSKANSEITGIACGGPGNCVATGWAGGAAFAVSYSKGRWHNAVVIRKSENGKPSIACPSAGNCVVGGAFADGSRGVQAFVVREVRGTWGKALAVPGIASLSKGQYAQVNSVACSSADSCAVVGFYLDKSRVPQPYVDNLVQGSWRTAHQVRGPQASRLGADLLAVSCASRGNCSAGGNSGPTFNGPAQAMVVNEVNGTWRKPILVPGIAALNSLKNASVTAISCATPGNCSAGGSYLTKGFTSQAFVVNEVKGAWRKGIEVPGTAALNVAGGGALVASISCAAPGNCSAGGRYESPAGQIQAYVVSEVAGGWKKAITLPGATHLGTQGEILALSCAQPAKCTAGGDYSISPIGQEAMVADEH